MLVAFWSDSGSRHLYYYDDDGVLWHEHQKQQELVWHKEKSIMASLAEVESFWTVTPDYIFWKE